jgi:hypothetical protein
VTYSDEKDCYGALVMIGFALGSALWVPVGLWITHHEVSAERGRAVEAGVGRWVVVPETGKTEFKYGVKE